GKKADAAVQKRFDQVAERVDRIGMIAVERDDNVACRMREAFFVCASVATMKFTHDDRSHPARDLGSAICGVVIDDDGFVDEIGKFREDLLNSFFLVKTGYNDGDAASFIHRNSWQADERLHLPSNRFTASTRSGDRRRNYRLRCSRRSPCNS